MVVKLFYVFDNVSKATKTVINNVVKCLEIVHVNGMSLMCHKCVHMMCLLR